MTDLIIPKDDSRGCVDKRVLWRLADQNSLVTKHCVGVSY